MGLKVDKQVQSFLQGTETTSWLQKKYSAEATFLLSEFLIKIKQ